MKHIKGPKEVRTLGKILQEKKLRDLKINIHRGEERHMQSQDPSLPFRSWVFSEKPSFQRYQPTYQKTGPKQVPQGIEIQKVNDPQVSVFKKVNEIKVVAELPGVIEEEVNLEIFDDVLVIETRGELQGKKTHYYKEILLPFPVEAKILDSSFNNTVLEVTLQKKKKEKLL